MLWKIYLCLWVAFR